MKVFTMFRSRGDMSSWSLFLLVRLYSSVTSFDQFRSVRFFLTGCNVLCQNMFSPQYATLENTSVEYYVIITYVYVVNPISK